MRIVSILVCTGFFFRKTSARIHSLLFKLILYNVVSFFTANPGKLSNFQNITEPDAPPTIVETWPSKFNAIKVYWSPIPESLRNGIILGYRIFYQSIDTEMRQYHRIPRAINPLAVYGAEPGEKMKEVNATTFETEIAELKNYSWYQVRIGAFTSKGLGLTITINGTTKQKSRLSANLLLLLLFIGINFDLTDKPTVPQFPK